MTTTDLLAQLARDLGDACGFELALVEESVIVEGAHVAATARSQAPAPARAVKLDALAKMLISPNEAGGTETWALVFIFVNGLRVAPPGRSHVTLKLERGEDGAPRWAAKGWKADVYEEWTGLERLDEE